MLKDKLGEHQRRLEEHTSGRRRLSGEEHSKVLRQIEVFSETLDKLENEGRKEKMEKVEELRESFNDMHRMDYIDFDKTGI